MNKIEFEIISLMGKNIIIFIFIIMVMIPFNQKREKGFYIV